jgi:hypothetical protein
MNCPCHDQPMYWAKHKRKPEGGYWRCGITERERKRERYANDPAYRAKEVQRSRDRYENDEAYREAKLQQQRDRYDNDFIYRATKNMHDAARRRRQTIDARRQRLEDEYGTVREPSDVVSWCTSADPS